MAKGVNFNCLKLSNQIRLSGISDGQGCFVDVVLGVNGRELEVLGS